MDWEKVDLTLEGHIGGEEHPNMPWHLRQHSQTRSFFPFDGRSDLYMDLFRRDRDDYIMIVDDHEMGREPIILRKREEELRHCVSDGGDRCDRCAIQVNVINRTKDWGCCDKCEHEMDEQMAANPENSFRF